MRKIVLIGLALLLSFPAAATAQEKKPGTKKVPNLYNFLKAAYSLRRQGKFKEAAAAYESILKYLGKHPQRRVIALEAAALYRVMGKDEKALHIYRTNNDVPRELDILIRLERYKEAHKVADLMEKSKRWKPFVPFWRARAQLGEGKKDEALKTLEAGGDAFKRERARILVELSRFDEAAKLYGELQDFYAQAEALDRTTRKRDAERAFGNAAAQITFRLRSETAPNYKKAKQAYKDAKDGVSLERCRLLLATRYAELGRDYRQWSKCLAGQGEKPKALKGAKNALKYLKRQLKTLEDTENGGCEYGKTAAKTLKLHETITEVEAELESYK